MTSLSDRQKLAAIRLLAIDIDGTLLTSDHRVLPEVRRAFADARAAALTLVLASARSPGALRHILEELDHAGPCVCFSGAWTGTINPAATSAAVIDEVTITQEIAEAIAEAAMTEGLVPSWHTERRWSVPSLSPSVEREIRVTRQKPVVTSDFAEAGAPNKILLIGPRELLLRLRETLAAAHGAHFDAMFSHETYLECLPKGADKARAVLALAGRQRIEMAGIAAVGDAQNDVAMIRAAGYGVAMANAIAEVKRAARWITASNDEGGVARLIDRILEARRP